MISVPKKFLYSVSVIALVGVLLGAFFAVRRDVAPVINTPVASNKSLQASTFADSFSMFFLGRSADGSTINNDTMLVRGTKFAVGEKVGLRVQTSSEVTNEFPIEIRFLKKASGEETPELQQYRQNYSIKPGLRTYCCVLIPKETGSFSLAILRNNAFIGSVSGIEIIPAKDEQSGALFGL